MHFRIATAIKAPADTVWRRLVQPELMGEWANAHALFQWTSVTQGGLGSTFQWREFLQGRLNDLAFETTEWKPGFVFGYQSTAGEFLTSCTARWEITPGGRHCSVVFTKQVAFPDSTLGVFGLVANRNARRLAAEELQRLKRHAEAIDA